MMKESQTSPAPCHLASKGVIDDYFVRRITCARDVEDLLTPDGGWDVPSRAVMLAPLNDLMRLFTPYPSFEALIFQALEDPQGFELPEYDLGPGSIARARIVEAFNAHMSDINQPHRLTIA